jgi:hypothetical protein
MQLSCRLSSHADLDLIARGLISSAEIRSIIFGFWYGDRGMKPGMILTYSSY